MSEEAAETGDNTDVDSLLTIMVALITVSLFSALPKRLLDVIPVVYVMLLFVLCLTSILIAAQVDLSSVFGALYLSKSNSELLQSLYLPPLIFSEVFKLNIRTFQTAYWQVMWLIFPGVVFGTGLTALYVLYLMPSGPPYFTVYEALCFGGALSTTDPIAVLMVLHEIGAPVRLKALVGGESLMNDGTSIIIVTLFLQLQEGVQYSGGDIVGFIFRELLVGPLFGLLVGCITLVCMRVLEDQVVPLVTLSFACPYITFIVVSTYFKSSGVLALVAMGLVINRFGRAFLNKHLEHVEAFWNQMEFFTTSLLYTQSGLYVAQDFYLGGITSMDWGSLFGLFGWITLVRGIMILLSFPILQRLGYGLTWREAVVMVHGGLRGAVSILLSITIAASPAVSDRTSSLTLFFIAGIVLLMCFNVVTTGPLCRALGLQFDKTQPVYATLSKLVEESTVQTLSNTGMENARKVWEDVADKHLHLHRHHPWRMKEAGEESAPLVIKESLVEKRYHLNLAFKQTFETLLETKLIKRSAWFALLMAVEGLIDEHKRSEHIGLMSWDLVETRLEIWKMRAHCGSQNEYHAVRKLFDQDEDIDSETFPNVHNVTVEHFTYCAFGLLVAHERSRTIMRETFFQDKHDLSLLLNESLKACAAPAKFINRVFVAFPIVIAKIKRHHVKAQVRRQNLGILRGMKRRGILSEAVLKQLFDGIALMDEVVEKIDFDLHSPLTVGELGEGLNANPNFGPFQKRAAVLLKRQVSLLSQADEEEGHHVVDSSSSFEAATVVITAATGTTAATAATTTTTTAAMEPEEDAESATPVSAVATAEEGEEDAAATGEFVDRVLNECRFPTMQETLERLENEQYVTEDVEPDVKF
ncbi:hypothetical protein BASA81_006778 [Batrachochytrium salamandrivorans]|nr:hypothetical protein BASA81_006778 [Batrachochytrium salamandrivorans]